MREREVRDAVSEFYSKHAPGGRSPADAFPAWWLHRVFEVAPTEAIALASTGSVDHGLDGFFLERRPDRDPTLHLLQAKFTHSHQQIREGIRDLRRALARLSEVLSGADVQGQENTVWTRLRARVHQLDRARLILHGRVIHLAEVEEETLLAQAKAACAEFEEAAAAHFPDHRVHLSLSGPGTIEGPRVSIVPGVKHKLAFEGVQASSDAAHLFVGLGKLADLVRLYEGTGDALFAKNVRLFNFKTAEHGPARFQRDTLRRICIRQKGESVDPMRFTLFHNGITLQATSAELGEGEVLVRNPGILNGCQTVKNAWRFRSDRTLKDKIDASAWESIRIPLRILRTTDEGLIREVTVSNNRQTTIRPSGFRANDSLQITLGERFRAHGVFYERQESAFVNLKRSSPRVLEEEYPQSFHMPVTMEELAQAIASVSSITALSVAAKVSDLFESPLYEKLFAEEHLRSIPLLIFSTNVLRAVHLALKDVREKTNRLEPMVPSRFRFLATRVVVRWVVQNAPRLIDEFGVDVIARPSVPHPFRDRLRKLLSTKSTGLQTLLAEHWGSSGEDWPSATDKACSDGLLRELRLYDFDAFGSYADTK